MFELLNSGGSFMYVILFFSIVALALFCERAVFLYMRLRLNMDSAYSKVHAHLAKKNYRAALEECNNLAHHPLGRTLKAGLLKTGKRDKEIEQALQESILREVPLVKKNINYLSLFANVATLLGLLGTIVGLIAAFSGVSDANPAEKQAILASGISIAMFTTAFGLIVSIPCLVGFYLLNNRGDYIIEKIDEKALSLFNVLSTLKRQGQE
ncbi:MotA/TolQ/ExbB proton channel family protein [Litoribacillus peritrichatus]|uniref:MotA/TolQ/ExbB proton channel family protein n=1 Tax=Litoribacillus peritrichatus TaxID=718191 RepID=A0ABP7M7P2_9GAMM